MPFLMALEAGSFILELLLFLVTKLGKVGAIPHIASINIYCVRVAMVLVLVLGLVLVHLNTQSFSKHIGLG